MIDLNPIKYTKAITVCSSSGDSGSLVCALLNRIFRERLDLSLPLVLQNLFVNFLSITKSQNLFLCVNKGEKKGDEVNAEKFPSHCCTHLFFVCFCGHTETKLLFS